MIITSYLGFGSCNMIMNYEIMQVEITERGMTSNGII